MYKPKKDLSYDSSNSSSAKIQRRDYRDPSSGMDETNSTPVSIRQAKEDDIPAIIALVLTSFRQFPLFDYLYSPLHEDKRKARDTIWIWQRRILRELLDTTTDVVVAELPASIVPAQHREVEDAVELESRSMLDWIRTESTLLRKSRQSRPYQIVGFSIWQDRNDSVPGKVQRAGVPLLGWLAWFKCMSAFSKTSCLVSC
jgi:hypothetical protein